MSRRQLVDAYVEGRISRRVFAKRLVATGVSAGAAASYAAALAPTASASGRESCLRDFYEDFYEARVTFAKDKDPKQFAEDVRKATENLVKCLRRDDDDSARVSAPGAGSRTARRPKRRWPRAG